jgi:ribosome-associated toxin RatA of RatAB toxin-antitoxin module
MAANIPYTGASARGRCVAAAAAAALALACDAHGAQDLGLDARLKGHVLAVSAHATIRAPLPVIWHTLTDYDHLAEFIPGMKASRVLQRHGGTVTIEQTGEAKFLIFHYPIAVVVQSDERYPAAIGVHLLSGNLRQLAGAYRIENIRGTGDQFVLRWEGIIEPDIPLPLLIAAPGLRETLANQFDGMVEEIERRGLLQANSRAE